MKLPRAPPAWTVALLWVVGVFVFLSYRPDTTNSGNSTAECQHKPNNDNDAHDDGTCRVVTNAMMRVPDNCRIVMATSVIPNAGWGVFSLVDLPRGMPILPGDLLIQVHDLTATYGDGMQLMLEDYLWNPSKTGGYYEGREVASVGTGLGMLVNGLPNMEHNMMQSVPTVDGAGLARAESPGAGAVTHYHNMTYFAFKHIKTGDELFGDYGPNWYRAHQESIADEDNLSIQPRGTEYLRQHGRCLDNLKPGRSSLPHAGRGAFATRKLETGEIVAPVPVLMITKRQALDLVRRRKDGTTMEIKQLILNYCFGHPRSSILLFPYSPMVNLVNHASAPRANVRLQWSKSSELHQRGQEWLQHPLVDVKSHKRSGLLLELVAIGDIALDEEIVMDYGSLWLAAWEDHVQRWQPPPDAASYKPSYVMEDEVKSLVVDSELAERPYPNNVFTSCFYRYSENKQEAEQDMRITSESDNEVATFRWSMTRGLVELRNLRPCQILQRLQDPVQGTLFTVRIGNRFALADNEVIPRGAVHLVTHVPRNAIRFSDKIYTTDQHLEHSFRHELALPDKMFPEQWKDLEQ